jgi:hypothetical protein
MVTDSQSKANNVEDKMNGIRIGGLADVCVLD